MRAPYDGTWVAMRRRVAAVLCLILLPICIAVPFMASSVIDSPSWGGAFAIVTFILLAGGIVVGAMNMSRGWDEEHE